MVRRVLTDAQWALMEPFCLGKASDPGRTGPNAREFLEAVLWIVRTSSPWRDLPEKFGKWNSVYRRFAEWRDKGVFVHMFNILSEADVDMEYAMIDATIVHVHRHGHGAKGGLSVRPLVDQRAA